MFAAAKPATCKHFPLRTTLLLSGHGGLRKLESKAVVRKLPAVTESRAVVIKRPAVTENRAVVSKRPLVTEVLFSKRGLCVSKLFRNFSKLFETQPGCSHFLQKLLFLSFCQLLLRMPCASLLANFGGHLCISKLVETFRNCFETGPLRFGGQPLGLAASPPQHDIHISSLFHEFLRTRCVFSNFW